MALKNIAYIDGANLHGAVRTFAWNFDYRRFRRWLRDKYHVDTAYLFIGRLPYYSSLYDYLMRCGYILVFKEVVYGARGEVKGNCDADMVVRMMSDSYEGVFDKALLVSSDGDYATLVRFLIEKGKLEAIVSPYEAGRCSVLLKRTNAKIAYVSDQKNILQNEKAPGADKTAQGSHS